MAVSRNSLPATMGSTQRNLQSPEFQRTCMSLLVTSCECSYCHRALKPPVKTCSGGHCVCTACVQDNANCPICDETYSCVRIIVLEKILSIVGCACVHARSGCLMFLDSTRKAEHETYCVWRKVNCYWCSWSGSLKFWLKHVRDQHGSHNISSNIEGTRSIPFAGGFDKTMFYINGVIYCLLAKRNRVMTVDNAPVFFTFQCFPTKKEDMETTFFILFSKSQELLFCQSIHPISDAIKTSDVFGYEQNCIVVPRYIRGEQNYFSFKIRMGRNSGAMEINDLIELNVSLRETNND